MRAGLQAGARLWVGGHWGIAMRECGCGNLPVRLLHWRHFSRRSESWNPGTAFARHAGHVHCDSNMFPVIMHDLYRDFWGGGEIAVVAC